MFTQQDRDPLIALEKNWETDSIICVVVNASDVQRFCSTGRAQRSSSGGPVVLVAWEHVNIQWLTEDLGVPSTQIPSWPDSDYDTVYVL